MTPPYCSRSKNPLRGNADGTGVVAYDADGEVLPVSAMTPLQRKAFERANAAYAVR